MELLVWSGYDTSCKVDGWPSKNNGTPKWMIYFMENPIKIDDLGGFPLFWVDTQIGPIGHSNRIFLGRAPVLQHHPGATKK